MRAPSPPKTLLMRALDRERGLPSNQVHRLAQDALDRLWLAGPSGLACHEGSRVRTFDGRHGLRCAGLRTVAVGPQRSIWIGTDLGVEAFGPDERALPALASLATAIGVVGCIVPSHDEVWLGTAQQGLLQWRVDQASGAIEPAARLDIGYVRDLVRLDDRHLMAVSALQGLVMVDGLRHHRLHDAPGYRQVPDALPSPAAVRRLARLPDGGFGVAATTGVWVFDADGERVARSDPAQVPGEVGAIAADGQRLWLGAGRLLIGYEQDGSLLREVERLDVGSPVNDILVDALGNVWVATDTAGVWRLSCLRQVMETVSVGDGSGAAVYVVRQATGGRGGSVDLLVGGDGFDARLALGADGRPALSAGAALQTTVWDIAIDPADGGRWLATQAGLYRVSPGAAPQAHADASALLSVPCRALMYSGTDLWVGTLHGLVVLRAGVPQAVADGDGRSLGYVYSIVLDGRGRLWVGTLGRGLWRQSASGFEPVAGGALSATANTYALALSPYRDCAVVVQNDGVLLLDGAAPARLLARRHAVAGWAAVWVDEHRVAIGSSDGLYLLDTRSGEVGLQLNALLGASAWEFTTSRSLAQGADGRLYCGLNSGLLAVNLAALARFCTPPLARLSGITWHGTRPSTVAGWQVVDPGKWWLEAQLDAAWMVDERQLRFRFRLVGFEAEWSEPGSAAVVRYSSLPTGRYLLQAQAHAPLTGDGPSVTVLRLEVRHRPVAVLFGALAAGYDRVFGTALRNRHLLRRHAELEAEIAARRLVEQALIEHRASLERQVALRTRQLETARDSAQAATRAKSEFLSRMSHELRTPLNAILGFAQLMQAGRGLDSGHQRFLSETLKAARHLLALVNEVLDLSHIEAGHLVLQPEPIDIDGLIGECLQMLGPAAQQRGVLLQAPAASGHSVLADQKRLRQVLLNLLSNAVKYNREQGAVTVALALSAPRRLRLTIADTGVGVGPQHLADLFQPFNRAGAELGAVEGSGIGLAISRQLMEQMGRSIGMHSQLGQGSAFWLELPISIGPAPVDPEVQADSVLAAPAQRRQPRCVLHVEDNEINRLVMSAIFERHPALSVVMAATAAQGLALAQAQHFDLLLLDIQLPDMDGYELLGQLRRIPALRDTPAVAVSADAMPDDLQRASAHGFAQHIAKPIDIAALEDMLARLLPDH